MFVFVCTNTHTHSLASLNLPFPMFGVRVTIAFMASFTTSSPLGPMHTIGPVAFQSQSDHAPVKYKLHAFQWKHIHWRSRTVLGPFPLLSRSLPKIFWTERERTVTGARTLVCMGNGQFSLQSSLASGLVETVRNTFYCIWKMDQEVLR